LTDVVCVNIPDKPGSLYRILEILTAEKINVDYMYAFSNNDVALAVIRAADIVQMSGVLEKNNQQLLSQADIYQL
ncbi:MAG: acetolactate synthase, partial [Proteiniphilum sp.]|nr:acetolactate synthase [Proteiniphilum sp.]